ncbi:MAG TPA: hypothetical protein VGG39_02825 [Polyangiaceae bacterium]|jgi:hypothetical protein
MTAAGSRLAVLVGLGLAVSLVLVAGARAVHAGGPGPADGPAPAGSTRCSTGTATTTFVAQYDNGSMAGTLTVNGAAGTRRFTIKAVPSAATYNLQFQGYGTGDKKPASETFTKGKTTLARLVAYGDVSHLFFDVDYKPSVPAPLDGFVCQ